MSYAQRMDTHMLLYVAAGALILLGLATALLSRRYPQVAVAGTWLALSFLGLVLVGLRDRWLNTGTAA